MEFIPGESFPVVTCGVNLCNISEFYGFGKNVYGAKVVFLWNIAMKILGGP